MSGLQQHKKIETSNTKNDLSKTGMNETVLTGVDIQTKNRFSSLANLEGNESASLQRATNATKHQVKGREIPTIVNGTLEYYKEFPSLTHKQANPIWTSAKRIQKKKFKFK